MLSIIIISKNAAKHIQRCLESVKWADEIIVLDSGSTDNTVDICKQYTDQVFTTDWPGFGPQKNRALAKATGEWVLSLDADEALSPELQQEIQKVIKQSKTMDAYTLQRTSKYCGKTIRFGDWRNDRVLRLFKHSQAKFSDAAVHESLQVKGRIGKLTQPLLHDAFDNLEQVLNKVNHYSTLGAQQKQQQGQRGGLLKAITHAGWTFFRGYVLRLGFLDGKAGFMLAISNAEGCYYRYLKLCEATA